MKYSDVMIYFNYNGANVARALGLTRASIQHWKRDNRIPYQQQLELEKLTNGELKANFLDDKVKKKTGPRPSEQTGSEKGP